MNCNLKGRRAVEFMNVEDFINVIKENPVLWDPQDSGYSNKHLRDDAWIKVSAGIIEEFYQRPVPEQDEINIAIQKKWRCLRTCYNRELLKKSEEKIYSALKPTKRKEYLYFEKLRFLDNIPRRTPNASSEENNEEILTIPKYIKCTSNKERDGLDEDGNQTLKRTRRLEPENYEEQDTATDFISIEYDSSNSVKHEDTSTSLKIPTQPYDTSATCDHSVVEDEDKMFLLSLLSDIKKIPQENKLRVKSDILLVIANGQAPGTYDSPFYRTS